MFQFTVQSANHSNVEAVCKISRKVLNSPLQIERMRRIYVEIIEDIEQIVMIAVHAGKAVGFIHAHRVNDLLCGTYSEISNVALLPYYQRRGAGTLLVLGVEQWSRQMITPDLKCILKSENEAVAALLKGCGYVENGLGAFEKTIV